MGEGDLLSAAMLIDTAQYYIFVVIPAYNMLGRFHWMPVLGPKAAFISYHMMRLYNRRFKSDRGGPPRRWARRGAATTAAASRPTSTSTLAPDPHGAARRRSSGSPPRSDSVAIDDQGVAPGQVLVAGDRRAGAAAAGRRTGTAGSAAPSEIA